jgi:CHASE2 domain-containing sensor protein
LQKRSICLGIIFTALALVVGFVSYFRLLDTYELILLDLRFKTRPQQKINPQIVIIEISNDTLNNLGRWPLSRDYHAILIKALVECEVKAIIFDVLFSEPSNDDPLLVEATKNAGNVYYPYALSLQQKQNGFWQAKKYDTQLLPSLQKISKGTGHANIFTDVDGKRRRVPLFIRYQEKLLPQLSLQATCDYLQIKPEEVKVFPERYVQLGGFTRIPIDNEGALLVNLAGKWKDTFVHYSYFDILFAYAHVTPGEKLPAQLAQLKDKVCFVGLTATGTAELSPTALEKIYPMIGLQANIFNSIVTKNFLRRLSPLKNLGILYLLCLLNIFLAFRTKPPLSILYRMGLLGLFISFGFLLFYFTGLWIDMFFPIVSYISIYLGTNLFNYIQELRKRQLLEKEFSIARNIQRSFLKKLPPDLPGVSMSVDIDTAHQVGGDLYDFVPFSDHKIGLMIGDVAGKGISAALFMAQVISQFRYFARVCSSPADTLIKLNREIIQNSETGLFVTMAYFIFDIGKNELIFASAGHLTPLVLRVTQHIEKIEVREGIPLGLLQEASFSQSRLKLYKQDTILLYTDGVTEARDERGKEFGESGIIQTIKGKEGLSAQQLIQTLKQSIGTFVGRAAQHDDITIMALKLI